MTSLLCLSAEAVPMDLGHQKQEKHLRKKY